MTTDQQLEVARLRITELEEDYALVDKALRKERKVSAALAAQLSGKHRQGPKAAQVLEVIEHWVSELGHHRVKVATDDKRADAVRKALGWGFTVEDLKLAIDGLARYPYVWSGRGRMRFGLREQRQDRLQTILSDTAVVERFIGYALEDAPDDRHVWVPAKALDRMHERVQRAEQLADAFRVQARSSMVTEHAAVLRSCWLDGEDTAGYEAQLRESCPEALEGFAAFKARRGRGQLRVLRGEEAA